MLKAALGLLSLAGLATAAAFSGAAPASSQANTGCDCAVCCVGGGCCCEDEVCLCETCDCSCCAAAASTSVAQPKTCCSLAK